MYVRFDYRCDNVVCPRRSFKQMRLIKKEVQDKQRCNTCTKPMTRLMAAPRTTFRFADRKLKP